MLRPPLRFLIFSLTAALTCWAAPAGAIAIPGGTPTLTIQVELAWTTGIPSGPEGLTFAAGAAVGNDASGADRTGEDVLYVSQGDSCSTGGCLVEVYTVDGDLMPGMGFTTSTFDGTNPSTAVGAVRGIDVLPNGNLLASQAQFTSGGRIVEIFASGPNAGDPVPGGIDFITPDRVLPDGGFGNPEPEAAILSLAGRDGGANTIYIGFEEAEVVEEWSLTGSFLGQIVNFTGPDTDAFVDPGGMAYDPNNDYFYVADDSSGGIGAGAAPSKIFLFDANGNMLAASDELKNVTDPTGGVGSQAARDLCEAQGIALGDPPNCNDPEGLAFDPDTGRLFLAFEDQNIILGFSLVPEPGAAALLIFAGLGLAVRARRR